MGTNLFFGERQRLAGFCLSPGIVQVLRFFDLHRLPRRHKKGPCAGPLCNQTDYLLLQPALDNIATVLPFPGF